MDSTFDEYHYENGKWQKTFSFAIDTDRLSSDKSTSVLIHFYNADGQPIQESGNSSRSSQNLPVDLTFPSKNYDANYLNILYLPDSDFQKYEANGGK
ncbi:hypothetical protein OQI89_14680 [Lentilactobacillus diolivorans]|uniref:hypothetical protein n=1 Tax=Lentilactobacillus diolivorans TaxID=179838 RepID=UPI00246826C4|nr:hypothetical protein [Lentilactobacillus diolivorans]MDH5107077.1 hypothetical protein [Lentilactobacillus diolivorans]